MSRNSDFAMRWRVRLGYPVALLYLVFVRPLEQSIFIGGAIALVGLCFRAAAAGHLRKHEQLATGGPYAYTRNPLYFGSALIAAGFLVAGRFWVDAGWVAAAVVVAYFGYFYAAVMKREAKELRSRYGAAFDEYAARVPLFLPRFRRTESLAEKFSWEQYWRNREYQAALGVLGGICVLWAILLLRGS
ncbi:MAG: isoprenylcysteine carboxylmethyltransferase family protein [Acidobacteria bacterium]|nr:isoprenylcysteine carboxylmethyltransferase family protein [Acidobacteriota bacterium]MCL5289323.1 isoprenylcysteine carboxylmethyltransferase family protein [Acidobacteriota bacterium]